MVTRRQAIMQDRISQGLDPTSGAGGITQPPQPPGGGGAGLGPTGPGLGPQPQNTLSKAGYTILGAGKTMAINSITQTGPVPVGAPAQPVGAGYVAVAGPQITFSVCQGTWLRYLANPTGQLLNGTGSDIEVWGGLATATNVWNVHWRCSQG
jgi:hypothetical protein